ncbi:MAG: lytic transglycosylase domain-containing protein, partial [Vicinamibacteria bacterium]|nr:lytic transglycosylase domain-containing protein [Vicinamibacteria bacterium]
RILYPIDFSDLLIQKARQQGLDPALVAAIIQQESTFDPNALSRAGARGLMQVIPPTGRQIARAKGVRYRRDALYDPAVSLDFGTFYLREVLDRFGQRPERALAAYNAGPHRVDRWTNGRPDMSAEEFIESIPFSETRHYVAIILAAQAQYRRLYPALSVSAQAERGAPPPQP